MQYAQTDRQKRRKKKKKMKRVKMEEILVEDELVSIGEINIEEDLNKQNA